MARETIEVLGNNVEAVFRDLLDGKEVTVEERERAYCDLDILLGLQLSAVHADLLAGDVDRAKRGLNIAMHDMGILFKLALWGSKNRDELAKYTMETGLKAAFEMMTPPENQEKEEKKVNGEQSSDPKSWQ